MHSTWTDGQKSAHDELIAYGEHQKSIKYYMHRIEKLEEDQINITSVLNGDMPNIQRTHDPTKATSKAARYIDLKTELEKSYHAAEDACMMIELRLRRALKHYPEHKRCLSYYYLFSLPLSEVAEVMNYSLSKVKQLRKEGLELFFRLK